MSDIMRIEINWDTGETKDLDPTIENLQATITDLKDKMRRGWWYEMEVPDMVAKPLAPGTPPTLIPTQKIRCEVVRKVEHI